MKSASAWADDPREQTAVASAYGALVAKLGAAPNVVLMYSAGAYDGGLLVKHLQGRAPRAVVHGCTSCAGVVTEQGYRGGGSGVVAMLGIHDPWGAYGCGASRIADDVRGATFGAIGMALEQAGRSAEIPDLILMTSAPGPEESVIRAVREYFGTDVPIAGGSSADDDHTGKWKQYSSRGCYDDAVVLTVLFPSTGVSAAFHSGYEPTEHRGRATRAKGRILYEIEGRAADEVYDEWSGGVLLDAKRSGRSVLDRTALCPLGRVVATSGEMETYLLVHPARALEDGGIELLAEVSEGDMIVLMSGSHDSLVSRASRVARMAVGRGRALTQVAGALVHYCSGSMLAIRDRMSEVTTSLRRELADAPFVVVFSHGEQGCLPSGECLHGNMMVSALTLRKTTLGDIYDA